MQILWWIGWFCAFGGSLWALWRVGTAAGRAAEREFRRWKADVHARLPIGERDFEYRHFRCEQVPISVALRVRQIFATFTGFPVEKVLPDDDFLAYIDPEDGNLLIQDLELEFGISIPEADAAKMKPTVRSASLVVAGLLQRSLGDAG